MDESDPKTHEHKSKNLFSCKMFYNIRFLVH